MRRVCRRTSSPVATLALLLLPVVATSQTAPDLTVGSDVRVKAPARIDAIVTGRLLALDEGSLTVQREGALPPLRIPKPAIEKLEVRRSGARAGRAMAIGVVLGTGLAAGAGAAICREDGWSGTCAALFAPLGAVAGAGAAHLYSHDRWFAVPTEGWHLAVVPARDGVAASVTIGF